MSYKLTSKYTKKFLQVLSIGRAVVLWTVQKFQKLLESKKFGSWDSC
jgi:hypothetical protein